MSWESRITRTERLLAIQRSVKPRVGACGEGVPVPFSQANTYHQRQCSEHGHTCWKRGSPREMAGAAMLLQTLKLGLPEPDYRHPPQELVDEAKEFLLAQGCQLYIESDEWELPIT